MGSRRLASTQIDYCMWKTYGDVPALLLYEERKQKSSLRQNVKTRENERFQPGSWTPVGRKGCPNGSTARAVTESIRKSCFNVHMSVQNTDVRSYREAFGGKKLHGKLRN